MQESVLYIVLALLCVVIYLLISQKKNKGEEKNNEELGRLKEAESNYRQAVALRPDLAEAHNNLGH